MPVSEFKALEKALVQLEDEDLSEWDREFIDGLGKRVIKYGRRVVITGAQQKQLDRIKEQYL
jgi:hypothetical protein